jgi:hypothetical protein
LSLAGRQRSGDSGLDIVVAVAPDEEGNALARELSRTGSFLRRIWPLAPRLPDELTSFSLN